MTAITPEVSQAAPPAHEQAGGDTRRKLDEARSKMNPNATVTEMLQSFFNDYKSRSSKENLQVLASIAVAIMLKKLGIKSKANEANAATGAAALTAESSEPENEAKTEEPPESAVQARPGEKKSDSSGNIGPALPPIDREKYKKGDLLLALVDLYPGVEVQGALQPFDNPPASKRHGVPKWDGKSTDNWNYAGVGNTDEAMEKGEYQIQSVPEPKDYTRKGTDNVPGPTLKKLVKIAELLRADSRMPLFTGIAMKVDGVEVMFVKEIHIHSMVQDKETGEWRKSDPSLSDYYYRPHTGVSYIMKKTS